MGSASLWIPDGRNQRPLASRLTEPSQGDGRGVVFVPPLGYRHSSMFWLWRLLSERLAANGIRVLRIDPHGTGDSPGTSAEFAGSADVASAFEAGVRFLRGRGDAVVAGLGCEFTGSVLLGSCDHLDVDLVVAVAPVISGKRYAREQRMLSEPVPNTNGHISVAGTVFTGEVLDAIAALDLSCLPAPVTPTVIIDRDASAAGQRLSGSWSTESPSAHDSAVCAQLTDVMDRPAEEAFVVQETVDALCTPLVRRLRAPAFRPLTHQHPSVTEAVLPAPDNAVQESFVTIGPDQLTGVLTRPAGIAAADLLVFLNSGSDPHTGPGRAWVDYARQIARDGFGVLRVDLRGWGDSPANDSPPGRPYDSHASGDVARLVKGLREDGWATVSVGGLCAGGWVALDVARSGIVDGVIALNPQMYWQPGDPVEALMSTTRQRREAEIASIKTSAAQGVWDAQDEAGVRPPAAQWLDELAATGSPISFIFSEGDDGLEYLCDRLKRRLDITVSSGTVTVDEIPGIDHGMQRVWLRPQMVSAILAALGRATGRPIERKCDDE